MKTLEIDPRFALAHYQLGQAYEQQRLYPQAIAEFSRAIELAGHNVAFDSNLAVAFANSGRRNEALAIAASMRARNDQNPTALANLALIYVGLGEHDEAMIWLNRAYAARFNPSILIRPGFDALRSDARFQDLMQRIGLPNAPPPSKASKNAARAPGKHLWIYADFRNDGLKTFGPDAADPVLQPAKSLDDRSAKFGDRRTPAAASADAVDRHPLLKGPIEALEELPGVAVTHGHRARSSGKRSALLNGLKQRDLAGADI
jgi:tetratricopeptide (TPR) repeat protein